MILTDEIKLKLMPAGKQIKSNKTVILEVG